MGSPGVEGAGHRLFSASPSSLNRWLDCPRRYRLQDVERHRTTVTWAHFTLGNAVHAALRDWVDLPDIERTAAAAQLLLRRHWSSAGFRDDRQSEEVFTQTSQALATYAGGEHAHGVIRARERTVATVQGHASISGRIDRLDERDDDEGEHLVVIDYKTNRRPPHPDEARTSMALALYVAAVRRTLKQRCYRVELHHVPTGQILTHEYDEVSLQRQLARVDAISAEVSGALAAAGGLADSVAAGEAEAIESLDAMFPARPGPLCRWCPMQMHCPQGQRMGPLHEPWAGVVGNDVPAAES